MHLKKHLFIFSIIACSVFFFSSDFVVAKQPVLLAQSKEDTPKEDLPEEDLAKEKKTTGTPNINTYPVYNPLGTTNINEIFVRITRAILSIIGILSFAVFVISGIRLIFGGIAEDQINTAKESMYWALIGITVALGSYAILTNVLRLITGV